MKHCLYQIKHYNALQHNIKARLGLGILITGSPIISMLGWSDLDNPLNTKLTLFTTGSQEWLCAGTVVNLMTA